MKQASTLGLESLPLDLTGMSDEAVKEVGLKYYLDLFLQNSRFGLHSCNRWRTSIFSRGRLKHAFYKAENWQITKRKNRGFKFRENGFVGFYLFCKVKP